MSIKKGLFFVFAAIILLVPIYVAVSSQNVLNNGKLYKFKPMKYDPAILAERKLLRINYETHWIPTKFDFRDGQTAYISIGLDNEGFAFFEEAFKLPPKGKDYVKTIIESVTVNPSLQREVEIAGDGEDFDISAIDTRNTVSIKIPDNMNQFVINEDDATRAEKVFFKEQEHIYVGVRVLDGEARLEDIYVHGKPLLDYLDAN